MTQSRAIPGQVVVSTPVSAVCAAAFRPGATLRELHETTQLRGPVVCFLNGKPAFQRRPIRLQRKSARGWRRYRGWENVRLRKSDAVEFVILPQGGDRQANKDMIRVVAMLALAIAAPYAAGAMLPVDLAETWMSASLAAGIPAGGEFAMDLGLQ
jgi:hypothetical protein